MAAHKFESSEATDGAFGDAAGAAGRLKHMHRGARRRSLRVEIRDVMSNHHPTVTRDAGMREREREA